MVLWSVPNAIALTVLFGNAGRRKTIFTRGSSLWAIVAPGRYAPNVAMSAASGAKPLPPDGACLFARGCGISKPSPACALSGCAASTPAATAPVAKPVAQAAKAVSYTHLGRQARREGGRRHRGRVVLVRRAAVHEGEPQRQALLQRVRSLRLHAALHRHAAWPHLLRYLRQRLCRAGQADERGRLLPPVPVR